MPLGNCASRWLIIAAGILFVHGANASNRDSDVGFVETLPAAPTPSDPILVRFFINHGANYIGTHSHVIVGNDVVVTLKQDGFSWSPNPQQLNEVFTEDIGTLSPGVHDILVHVLRNDGSSALDGGDLVTVVAEPDTRVVQAIEYYNASLDHFFLTADPSEIAALDNQAFVGWQRTGLSISVYAGHVSPTVPVCRYYIPQNLGDSHFFSAFEDECQLIIRSIAFGDPPQFDYRPETTTAFYVTLPDASGSCASPRVPVYRLWNGRADSNHRYTTSTVVRAQMLARNFVSEGLGPDGVGMCALP